MKDFFDKIFTYLKNEIEKIPEDVCTWMVWINIEHWPSYPKQVTDSLQSSSKFQSNSLHTLKGKYVSLYSKRETPKIINIILNNTRHLDHHHFYF